MTANTVDELNEFIRQAWEELKRSVPTLCGDRPLDERDHLYAIFRAAYVKGFDKANRDVESELEKLTTEIRGRLEGLNGN